MAVQAAVVARLLMLLKRSPRAFMAMLSRFPKVQEMLRQGGKTAGAGARKTFSRKGMGQMAGGAKEFGRNYGQGMREGWKGLSPRSRTIAKFGGAGAAGMGIAGAFGEDAQDMEERLGRELLAELDRMGMLKKENIGPYITESPEGLPAPPQRRQGEPEYDYFDPWRERYA